MFFDARKEEEGRVLQTIVCIIGGGGIENPRLLLAFNKNHASGLGNANDLVGRYFMDHPRLLLGNMRFRPQWLRNKLYDIRFHNLSRAVSANGTHVAAQLNVAPELQGVRVC